MKIIEIIERVIEKIGYGKCHYLLFYGIALISPFLKK